MKQQSFYHGRVQATDADEEVQLDFTPEIEVFVCCLRDVIQKIQRDLSNRI